jgi:hypothetical protein
MRQHQLTLEDLAKEHVLTNFWDGTVSPPTLLQ